MEYTLITKDNVSYQMRKGDVNVPPGLLQYKVKETHITGLSIDELKMSNLEYKRNRFRGDMSLEPHSKENLLRLTPKTKTGTQNKWKIILVMGSMDMNGKIMKGALRNIDTREIALITTKDEISSKKNNSRMIKSHDKTWNICQCKMIAPLFFWDELKNRLLY